jgi:hypothetical protein
VTQDWGKTSAPGVADYDASQFLRACLKSWRQEARDTYI